MSDIALMDHRRIYLALYSDITTYPMYVCCHYKAIGSIRNEIIEGVENEFTDKNYYDEDTIESIDNDDDLAMKVIENETALQL